MLYIPKVFLASVYMAAQPHNKNFPPFGVAYACHRTAAPVGMRLEEQKFLFLRSESFNRKKRRKNKAKMRKRNKSPMANGFNTAFTPLLPVKTTRTFANRRY